ncbi:MAG: hypothetical protein WC492_03895 [Candidatus Micrarchaeia archaeon]
MGITQWLAGKKKEDAKIHSSQDFRKEKTGPAPRIPYVTDAIAFPYLGPVSIYYITLLIFFFLFIFTKSGLVGLLAGINIVFIVMWEFYSGSKEGNIKNELKDTAIAIFLGLVVWFGSGFLLNTPTPINAIVSCSMLPVYERGDMVILQGGEVKTQYLQYAGSLNDINLSTVAYYQNQSVKVNGSIYSYCSTIPSGSSKICDAFRTEPYNFYETHGPLKIEYGACVKYYSKDGKEQIQPCVKKTYFQEKEISFDKNAELIVYQPKKGDVYALVGDIVHRVRFAINASDGIIYFTKGDNNPIYDFQYYFQSYKMGNSPVQKNQIKGRIIVRIPFLGNFKLFITPDILFLDEGQTGCNAYFVS